MRRMIKTATAAAVSLGLAATMGGCPSDCASGDPAALVGLAQKIADCRMLEITACEIQLASKIANEASEEIDTELTAEEAAAAVDFLKLNNVKCIEELEALFECAQVDPNCAQIPESLQTLIDERDKSTQ
ncbi:MAG: hypothetical protein IPM64_01390 [Phycisphaerales bacterium]|nr:hypothetical protein [Phycisphaerales bacterium]